MGCSCLSPPKKISIHTLPPDNYETTVRLFFACIADVIYYAPWILEDVEGWDAIRGLDPLGKHRCRLDETLQLRESSLYRKRWETEKSHMQDSRPSTAFAYKNQVDEYLQEIDELDQLEEWLRPQLESIGDRSLTLDPSLQETITRTKEAIAKVQSQVDFYREVRPEDHHIIRRKLTLHMQQGIKEWAIRATSLQSTYIRSLFTTTTKMNQAMESTFWAILGGVLDPPSKR